MGFEGLASGKRADVVAHRTADDMLAYLKETDAKLTMEEFLSLSEDVEWRADARKTPRPLRGGVEGGLLTP